jgi:hypothetical protein
MGADIPSRIERWADGRTPVEPVEDGLTEVLQSQIG